MRTRLVRRCARVQLVHTEALALPAHTKKDEELDDTPQSAGVRGTKEHNQVLAARQKDGKSLKIGLNVTLVDTRLVEPDAFRRARRP